MSANLPELGASNKSNLWIKQSLRLLHHEFRRGELTIICLAIVLAVATVFSLSGFSGQIKQALLTNSSTYIAADRVLRTSRVASNDVIEKSQFYDLQMAEKVETESMVFAGDNMLLSELSVISNSYPLRGELKVKKSIVQQESTIVHAPEPGSVWVEPSVLTRLEIQIGDEIEIGVASFEIKGIITDIPDRSYRAFIAGPTIIVNIVDLAKTELVQPGSRLTYKYLFAGENDAIKSFEEWLKPQLNDTQRFYDAKQAQSRLSNTLTTAEKFLSLASMLGIVLAAVAVAVASRRYGQRHQPMVAVFKALGASVSHIRKLYYLHWSLLSLISISIGLVVGYCLLLLGISAIDSYLSLENTDLGYKPFSTAVITGLLCAIAFAIQPIKSLIKTSPLSVIRGFSHEKPPRFGLHQLPPLLALFALLMMFSQDFMMSISLLIGGMIVSIVLLLFGQGLMSAGRSVGSQAGKSWHLALANLKRRASENSVQLVSFTIAIKLLLLIVVMKNSIISEWQQQFPENTPNHYVMNIAENQLESIGDFVNSHDIQSQGFYQVFRGRISAVNGELLLNRESAEESNEESKSTDGDLDKSETTEKQEAKNNSKTSDEENKPRQGMGRELGLTWRDEVPYQNELIEGQWWQKDDQQGQVSIESSIAERMSIKLGDELTFDLGGKTFTVPVTSIREVNWKSRQLNFIMVFNKPVLKDFPATYISAWMVPEQAKTALAQFFKEFPTVTMMDFGAILKQLYQVIEQVSIAIELILVLVVLAGSLVLVAQVQASMEERERELAILRTLGAKGSLLRNSVLFEFVALGAIAGLMASIAMEIAVYFLQTQVFDMSASFHFSYWLLGIGVGAGFVGFVGLFSCWRLLRLSSVTLIRRTM
ncbi:MAG: FtsX-like permease family protein [Colwellia sp.]|nr:FtsX-like permease family protein [Colwellia sp.]